MRIVSPCVRPKGAHKQEIHIFTTFFDTFANHESSQELLVWGHSKHILGSFGDFGMTFRTIWVYEDYFDIILMDFQNIFIFPTDFSDVIYRFG